MRPWATATDAATATAGHACASPSSGRYWPRAAARGTVARGAQAAVATRLGAPIGRRAGAVLGLHDRALVLPSASVAPRSDQGPARTAAHRCRTRAGDVGGADRGAARAAPDAPVVVGAAASRQSAGARRYRSLSGADAVLFSSCSTRPTSHRRWPSCCARLTDFTTMVSSARSRSRPPVFCPGTVLGLARGDFETPLSGAALTRARPRASCPWRRRGNASRGCARRRARTAQAQSWCSSRASPTRRGPQVDSYARSGRTGPGAWPCSRGGAANSRAHRARRRRDVGALPAGRARIRTSAAVYLVTTAPGRLGTDLDADHAVMGLAPLDSMIQRLGRVKRTGTGEATITVVCTEKAAKPPNPAPRAFRDKLQSASQRTLGTLRGCPMCPRRRCMA